MKLKNQIVNYFVSPPLKAGKSPRVFSSPVTMNYDVARKVIEDQLKKNIGSTPLSPKPLLHVCFDLDSSRIYIPNATAFPKDQMEMLLKAAEIKITKDYGGFMSYRPIEGSPFSSIRVRSISGFGHASDTIKERFNDKEFVDLPVIEANLARMPTTMKQLPPVYRNYEQFIGGLIDNKYAESITFYDEKELSGKNRPQKIQLLTQPTPFILINTSPVTKAGVTEKEWAVLSGYRDFAYGEEEMPDKTKAFADLYAAKRHLYLGWPFEEVCNVLLEGVSNFGELINAINALVATAVSLQAEGFPNPSAIPYYITFKIDPSTFPLQLGSLKMGENQFDPNKQMDNFKIIEYDAQTKYILIETPAFISPELCHKILRSVNRPLITRYNPAVGMIDVKSKEGTYREYRIEKNQLGKIGALVTYDLRQTAPPEEQDKIQRPKFRDDERSRGVSLANPNVSHIRDLTEYYHATEYIKKYCEKMGVEFKNVKIVIGPIERIFGRGVQGGFMGAKQFALSKLKIPHELEPGLFVSPPVISINSVNMPSYAEQTTTLIHEYCHNVYSITNPEHEHLYNKDKGLRKKDELKYWELYFDDPDERRAHIEEIKYELIAGRSIDEIIRDKIGEARGQVGGAITLENRNISYPIALKFRELVIEAATELERENEINEKPTGTDTKLGRSDLPTT